MWTDMRGLLSVGVRIIVTAAATTALQPRHRLLGRQLVEKRTDALNLLGVPDLGGQPQRPDVLT